MMVKSAAHQHKFEHPELVTIVADNDHYHGTTRDKAFLMRSCACGAKQAYEYGETTKMKELLKGQVLK